MFKVLRIPKMWHQNATVWWLFQSILLWCFLGYSDKMRAINLLQCAFPLLDYSKSFTLALFEIKNLSGLALAAAKIQFRNQSQICTLWISWSVSELFLSLTAPTASRWCLFAASSCWKTSTNLAVWDKNDLGVKTMCSSNSRRWRCTWVSIK